jgi:hypothetical protein
MKKVTVELPERDLNHALDYSGAGVTETLRTALREYVSREAQRQLLNYRGKVKFKLTLDEIKYDR